MYNNINRKIMANGRFKNATKTKRTQKQTVVKPKRKPRSTKKKNNKGVPKLVMTASKKRDMVSLLELTMGVQSKTYKQEKITEYITNYFDAYNETSEDQFSYINYYIDSVGNIYAEKGFGDTFPCIVAHIDTVHKIIPKKNFKVINTGGKMLAIDSRDCSRVGVGGDDKVGVFLALSMLSSSHENVKAAFFVNEEHGCLGSNKADMGFFENVSFALQGDRQGYDSFVDSIMGTSLYDDKFKNAISPLLKKYNKTETSGGMTDVEALVSNGLEVAVANCSCGYYEPHTSKEYIVIDQVLLTYQLFFDIITDLYKDGDYYKVDAEKRSSYSAFGSRYNQWGYSPNMWDDTNWGSATHKVGDTPARQLYQDDVAEIDEEQSSKIVVPDYNLRGQCPYCGGQVTWDNTVGYDFCFMCDDYIYNPNK